jgi:hypothetical protein
MNMTVTKGDRMKRLSMVCAAALMAGLLAGEAKAQDTVTSVNVVGFSTEDAPANQWTLISPPFTQVDGTTNTLMSVFGTDQLAQHPNPNFIDRVAYYQTGSQTYQFWGQRPGSNTFFKANNGTEWVAMIPGDPICPPGTAIWFVPRAGTSKTLKFSGQVVDVATQSVEIISGLQLISYPFSTEIALTNMALSSQAAASPNPNLADKIKIWEGDGYQFYGLHSTYGWIKANSGSEWVQFIAASNTIALNEGFWFDRGVRPPFTWNEPNPYFDNLK